MVHKKNSVIQTTMIKITLLIFCILVMLYMFIARIYWEKEVLKREFELQSIANAVELKVQANYQWMKDYPGVEKLNTDDKVLLSKACLENSLSSLSEKHSQMVIGYYDVELNSIVTSPVNPDNCYLNMRLHQKMFDKLSESLTPEFISDSDLTGWDGKGVIGVAVPVFYHDKIIGHTWAMMDSSSIFYQSYMNYSKVFIPSIIIWILVLLLIKASITKIREALDSFSRMIVKERMEDMDELEKLPELLPVYEKIKTHLDHVEDLNNSLEESNAKLLTIMEGISDGFFSLDQEWRFTFVNEETKRIMRRENDLIGKNIWDELPENINPEDVSNLKRALLENIPMHWETTKSFKYYEIHAYPFAKGLSVFIRDITEIRQQEAELVRLERLNLIGQMAAGISHEVRNPLTTVRGFLQMIEARSESDRDKEYMEIMISEIDRANGIITDFLSLAKANNECTAHENINEIISRIFPMLQADAFNSNKDVVLQLGDIPVIDLNESEIRQLILNLVRNGLEETADGGQVTISTYQQEDYVVLAIEDEGNGIPPEVQEKMGTPFITTKETGTGLGLAISIGIARRHKAKFEFQTGSEGTTFYIKFPLKVC